MNALTTINDTFRQKEVVNKMTMALGFRSDDDAGRQEAFKYIASVLAEIQKSSTDEKKDLTQCDPQSLVQCAIDAAQLKLAIDGRQHAHLVKSFVKGRGAVAELRVGVRGFVSKITEHYPDADISATLVFEGDELAITKEDGIDHYTLKKADVFESKPEKLKGVLVVMSFTKGDKRFQHCEVVNAAEIGKIRKKAKFDGVWAEWFGEKAKVAAVKRATKFVFAGLTGLQELIRYDNAKNFQLMRNEDAPKPGSIVGNLNASLKGEPPPAEPPTLCGTCHGSGVVEDTEGKGPCPDCGEVE